MILLLFRPVLYNLFVCMFWWYNIHSMQPVKPPLVTPWGSKSLQQRSPGFKSKFSWGSFCWYRHLFNNETMQALFVINNCKIALIQELEYEVGINKRTIDWIFSSGTAHSRTSRWSQKEETFLHAEGICYESLLLFYLLQWKSSGFLIVWKTLVR